MRFFEAVPIVYLLLIAVLWKAVMWNLRCLVLAHVGKGTHAIHVLTLAVLPATYCKFINVRYECMPRFIFVKPRIALLTLSAWWVQTAQCRLLVLRVR